MKDPNYKLDLKHEKFKRGGSYILKESKFTRHASFQLPSAAAAPISAKPSFSGFSFSDNNHSFNFQKPLPKESSALSKHALTSFKTMGFPVSKHQQQSNDDQISTTERSERIDSKPDPFFKPRNSFKSWSKRS